MTESEKIAAAIVRPEPVRSASGAALLTKDYETTATNAARSQPVLAAERLANLINRPCSSAGAFRPRVRIQGARGVAEPLRQDRTNRPISQPMLALCGGRWPSNLPA